MSQKKKLYKNENIVIKLIKNKNEEKFLKSNLKILYLKDKLRTFLVFLFGAFCSYIVITIYRIFKE